MQFISMDLLGEPYPKSKAGNSYVLSIIYMLTGYTFCITLNLSQLVKCYRHMLTMYMLFGGSTCIFPDDGIQFKNSLSEDVAKELRIEYILHTLPYHPQSKCRIEGFHHFLKACISKHVSGTLECDHIVPLVCASTVSY